MLSLFGGGDCNGRSGCSNGGLSGRNRGGGENNKDNNNDNNDNSNNDNNNDDIDESDDNNDNNNDNRSGDESDNILWRWWMSDKRKKLFIRWKIKIKFFMFQIFCMHKFLKTK